MLTRAAAEAVSTDRPEKPKRWKPSTWTLESDGGRLLVKDVSRANPVFRFLVGRWTLRREERVYRRLTGMTWAARFVGRLDADAIVLEQMDAVQLSSQTAAKLDLHYFDELRRSVDEMHRHGIVHLDLRHRTNILVGTDKSPRIVDFENALYLGSNALCQKLLVPLLAWIDYSAVLKFRVRYFPGQVSEAEVKKDRFYSRVRKLWPFGRMWPPRRFAE